MKNSSKAQIIATIGPSSFKEDVLESMALHQMDIVRFNFSWSNDEERKEQINLIRKVSKKIGKRIPIIADLPGPRVQKEESHTYDTKITSSFTDEDEKSIKFGIEQNVDYFALSFVGNKDDVKKYKEVIKKYSGNQKIISKIERKIALDNLLDIIEESDAVMVARGDLINEIPIEQLPFIQDKIVKEAKNAGKPVIVATEMLLSMTKEPRPTRAEITDVANAILGGADSVMLSEETSTGKYPIEAVTMMEKIVLEAEKHLLGKSNFNTL